MVHTEVYLNKYVVCIAPFSTLACPDCSQYINISLSNFSSIFPGGQLTAFAPMCGRPCFLRNCNKYSTCTCMLEQSSQNLRGPHVARQQLFDRYLLPAPDLSSKPAGGSCCSRSTGQQAAGQTDRHLTV